MRRFLAIVSVVFALLGCSSMTPTISEDKIKTDLIGQKFAYGQQTLFGQQVWTIEPDEIRDWRLLRRATDRSAGTDVIYAAVRLVGGNNVISGNLKIIYRLYDKGWQFDKVSADSDFSISSKGKGE